MVPSDDIVIKHMPREQRVRFYLCVFGTMAIVLVGWALTMRDQISQVSFIVPVPILQDVKEGVTQITAEVKANANAPAVELEAAMSAILVPVIDGVEQRQEAVDTVSEIMKTQLETAAASDEAAE